MYKVRAKDNENMYSLFSEPTKEYRCEGTHKIAIKSETKPTSFELCQNYPNPFNPSTVISYSIPNDSKVTLKVYNQLGQEVKTLVDGFKEKGVYNVDFDGKDLSSGIYIYKIQAGEFSQTSKMILMK